MEPDFELPTYPASGCTNERCSGGASNVLSLNEVDKMYPIKDPFDWWPVPPGTAYVCTKCGFCYGGLTADYARTQEPTARPQRQVDLDAFQFDPTQQYDGTVREAVEAFVESAPDGMDPDDIAAGVNRFVTGADRAFAREVMAAMDSFERSVITADEFM